ncbi:MAG TPA: UDP-3-O-acyl-N-acetylglucosamine deacetylase [Candidatus Obscuribacterales bacterium]
MRAAAEKAQDGFVVTYTGRGATSRRDINISIESAPAGSGVIFRAGPTSDYVTIPARASSVVNTLRNVVVGKGAVRICIVEHLLAALAIWGLEDVIVGVDGPEIPLGDGSAAFWVGLFEKQGIAKREIEATIDLAETFTINNKDRSLIAIPDSKFSITYLMDWNHPLIQKRWQTWEPAHGVEAIAKARTFASLKEHQLLGLDKDLVSLTENGFTSALHFDDEPVRHKLLDLLGDLMLCGVNPMKVKARFISIKGGHEMDVQLASHLERMLIDNKTLPACF